MNVSPFVLFTTFAYGAANVCYKVSEVAHHSAKHKLPVDDAFRDLADECVEGIHLKEKNIHWVDMQAHGGLFGTVFVLALAIVTLLACTFFIKEHIKVAEARKRAEGSILRNDE